MDHHQGHGQSQMPYGATQYQANQMIRPSPSGPFDTSGGGTMQITGQPTAQLAYQQIHQQQQQLQNFWADKCLEIEETTDFKNHSLPLARIKKIMKADEDVKMISAEAPVIFARACEMFILELTLRSWNHTEESKRRTLQKNDIAAAIARTDIFDFLVDIEPREDLKDEVPSGGTMPVGDLADPLPYYYMTPQLSAQQSHHPYLTQQVYPQSLQHHQQPPADS